MTPRGKCSSLSGIGACEKQRQPLCHTALCASRILRDANSGTR